MYSPNVIDRRLFQAKKAGLLAKRLPREVSMEIAAKLEKLRFDGHGQPLPEGQLARELDREENLFIESERILCKADFEYWFTRYCNPPEAPIWMWDGSFCPIGEVRIGDKVVGWHKVPTRKTPGAKYNIPGREHMCESTVIAIKRRMGPLIHVRLESGARLSCTQDHLWSNGAHYKSNVPWVQADDGITLRRFCIPDDPRKDLISERDAGWLGGIIDGEGSFTRSGASIAQQLDFNPEVYAEIVRILNRLGLDIRTHARGISINGGKEVVTLLLNLCRPVKRKALFRHLFGFCWGQPDKIVHVECGPRSAEVVSLQTTTGNYVAWGYASKNCSLERDPGVGSESGIGPARLLESQHKFIREMGRREEVCHAEFKKYKHTAGIRIYAHKCRQVAFTATCAGAKIHRMLFWPGTRAFAATLKDGPQGTGELYKRDLIALNGLPFWLKPARLYPNVKDEEIGFEAPLNCRLSYQAENQQTGIGTGTQQDVSHLTEVPLWSYPQRIRYSFVPSIPSSIMTLHVQEGTSAGKGGYWQEVSEDCRHRRPGYEDWIYIFVGWYTNRTKYRSNAPDEWIPDEHTIKHAELVAQTSPEFCDGIATHLSRDQMYWWEKNRALHASNGELSSFLANFPATPQQSFTNWAQGALPIELLEQMEMEVRDPRPYEVIVNG